MTETTDDEGIPFFFGFEEYTEVFAISLHSPEWWSEAPEFVLNQYLTEMNGYVYAGSAMQSPVSDFINERSMEVGDIMDSFQVFPIE